MTYNELCEAILTAQEEMLKCKIEANSVTLNGRRYGKLIENCPPNMKPTIFGMTVKADYAMPDDYDFLVQYEPPQPKTNGDRMTCIYSHEDGAYCDKHSHGAVTMSCYGEENCPDRVVRNIKPQTNGDKIRGMTDEELARFVTREDLCELTCGPPIPCDGRCESKMLAWLKSPAEEGEP